ncbi:hypothetical protein [Sorangium sp. So ce1099]|uniref:hypothetical protein n=1 Tax=Sorangium sp. So ce1099 TaxID=3133331 RepID=UPI003F635B29
MSEPSETEATDTGRRGVLGAVATTKAAIAAGDVAAPGPRPRRPTSLPFPMPPAERAALEARVAPRAGRHDTFKA